jgi:MFS family permease
VATKLTVREIWGRSEIRAAMVGTFVIMLGFGIVAPVLPKFGLSFGASYSGVGVMVASFSLTRLLCDPFTGRIIDRFGERRVATVGALIVGVSSALSALAPNFGLLIVSRAAGGVGSAVFFSALLSYMLHVVEQERVGSVMGVYYASFNVGIILGQPIGGLIATHLGLRSVLWVYAAACASSALLFWTRLHSPGISDEDERRTTGLRALPWSRAFVTVMVVNLAYMWMVGGMYSYLIQLYGNEGLGMTLAAVGVGLAIASLTELAVLVPAGRATDRVGRKGVLVPSFVGLVAITLMFAVASTPALFMVTLALFGISTGYSGTPEAPMLQDLTPKPSFGTAVAVFRFSGDLGMFLGPLVAGLCVQHLGYQRAFVVSAIPSAIALGLLLTVPETFRAAGATRAGGSAT